MTFTPAVALAGARGGSEPRATFRTDAAGVTRGYVATNLVSGGTAATYESTDGATWSRSPGTMPNQDAADDRRRHRDDAVRPAGAPASSTRSGINFRNAYSDDGGKTWTGVDRAVGARRHRPAVAGHGARTTAST